MRERLLMDELQRLKSKCAEQSRIDAQARHRLQEESDRLVRRECSRPPEGV